MKFQTYRSNPPVDPGLRFDEVDEITGEFKTPSMTLQSEADACDINKIMERFDRTGQIVFKYHQPQYGDARIVDFQTAKQIVIDAENEFNALPSKTRKYFGDSPEAYVKELSDALANGVDEEAFKKYLDLGIALPRQETDGEKLDRIARNTEKETVQK